VQEIEKVEKQLEPFHAAFDKSGGTMMWDGWTNCANMPLENIMLSNPKGVYLHKALPFDGGCCCCMWRLHAVLACVARMESISW